MHVPQFLYDSIREPLNLLVPEKKTQVKILINAVKKPERRSTARV